MSMNMDAWAAMTTSIEATQALPDSTAESGEGDAQTAVDLGSIAGWQAIAADVSIYLL